MDSVIFFIVFILFAGGTFAWSFFSEEERRENWTLLAKSLDVKFENDMISGCVDDVEISVSLETRGRGKSRHYVTVFKGDIEGEGPASLSVELEGVRAKVAKVFGAKDVHLGVPELDSKLMVNAVDVEAVRKWVRQNHVIAALHEACNLSGFKIYFGTLSFETRGAMSDVEKMRSQIGELTRIVKLLSARVSDTAKLEITQADEGAGEDVLW